jgi:hypothetical protein
MITVSDSYNGTSVRRIYFDEVKAITKLKELLQYRDNQVIGVLWKMEEDKEPQMMLRLVGTLRHSPSHR